VEAENQAFFMRFEADKQALQGLVREDRTKQQDFANSISRNTWS